MDTACWKTICLGIYLLKHSCSAYSFWTLPVVWFKNKDGSKTRSVIILRWKGGKLYYSLRFNIKNYSHWVVNLCSCEVVEKVLYLKPIWAVPLPTFSSQDRDTSNSSNIIFVLKITLNKPYSLAYAIIRMSQNWHFCALCFLQKVSCLSWEEVSVSINKICKDIGNREVICEQNNVIMPSPSARRRRCGPLHSHRKWYPHQ